MAWDKSDDNIANIVNMLDEDWDSDNVVEPTIRNITDVTLPKRIDLRMSDYVLIYEAGYTETVHDIGFINLKWTNRISIDIRTCISRDRVIALWKEVRRILWANRKHPTDSSSVATPFQFIRPISRLDLSNKQYKMWRYVYDVNLETQTEAVAIT